MNSLRTVFRFLRGYTPLLVFAAGILIWERLTGIPLSPETKWSLYGGAFLGVTFANWRKENKRADVAEEALVSSSERDEVMDIARKLVTASFPKLEPQRIRLEFVLSNQVMASTRGSRIRLSLGDICRMNTRELTGLLVHELCHMERDYDLAHELPRAASPSRPGWLATLIRVRQYARSAEYRTRIERETDQAAIAKGYGKELLALMEYHDENYEDYDSTDGLTREEIRAELEKMELRAESPSSAGNPPERAGSSTSVKDTL